MQRPTTGCEIERGAARLRKEVMTRPAPRLALAHGDWLPKHLLIDAGAIAGVIDWELAGPASPSPSSFPEIRSTPAAVARRNRVVVALTRS